MMMSGGEHQRNMNLEIAIFPMKTFKLLISFFSEAARRENLFAQYQQNVTRLLSLGSPAFFFHLVLGFYSLLLKRYQHVCFTFNSRETPSSEKRGKRKGEINAKRNVLGEIQD
jgi:hypothetical protein